MKNLMDVIDHVEGVCQDPGFCEQDGRLVDFISDLVMEEKEAFQKYEATGVVLDKNETETVSSDCLGELTAEFLNAAFAVGYLLGQTDFKSNNHLPQNVRKIMGEIKTRLIKEGVLDPEVLPSNRCCGAKKSLVRIAQGGNGNGAGQKSKPALATS